MSRKPILIAGAGIAGLSLALALARQGIASHILERRDELSEAGAGIQLGPNAMQVLTRLGVAARLEPEAGRPEAIIVRDGSSGRRLTTLPLGQAMRDRFGAPYRVAHRADLQAALIAAVHETSEIALVTGFEVVTWDETEGGIVARSAGGGHQEGSVLIGADGLWSTVRHALFPGHPLGYAGKRAARTMIPARLAAKDFKAPSTGVWLGQDAHVVHYPVRGHREIAVVAIVDEAVAREGWGGPIESSEVLARLKGFAPELLAFVDLGVEWRVWSLYDPPPLPAWSRGRVCMIGDAAHPILPFLAQGGAMAIEDAETLARALALSPLDPGAAFARFETLRRARVLRVQEASRANGRIFHMHGLPGLARDVALSVAPSRMMMARYDWLYGWNGDNL